MRITGASTTNIQNNTTPYAEDVNYWKTSKSSPDAWIERARRQIERLGGHVLAVLAEGFGCEPDIGRAAFMLAFELDGERFKVVWPVLPSKTKDERAARVQAATLLFHDIKAKCISATVLGARAAFFSFLMLPDGRTAADVATPELVKLTPALLWHHPHIPNRRHTNDRRQNFLSRPESRT